MIKPAMNIRRNPAQNSAGWLAGSAALAVCLGGGGMPAFAQNSAQAQTATPSDSPPDKPAPRDIVVYGTRVLIASLKDFRPERVYDEDQVAAFGVGSVGELLNAVTAENGDSDPQVLVNGRPVASQSEIADLPVEAVARVEQMPRGSSSRVGGDPGQRTYNVVLKQRVTTVIGSGTYQTATEGGWDNVRADAVFTHVRGNDRINLSLRAGWSGDLLYSERPVTLAPLSIPYSPTGNVIPFAGAEIDPALSMLAGQPVTLAAVPPGRANPTLADFAGNAGRINPSDIAGYRSLRGQSRPIDLSLTANKEITPWLSAGFSGRLSFNRDRRFNGLPSARFVLPVGHPFSPFSRNVVLAFSDPTRPLTSRSRSTTGNAQVSLNVLDGDWRGTLVARYDERDRRFEYDLVSLPPGGNLTIANSLNPFATSPAGLIPVISNLTTAQTSTIELQADAEGPIFAVPTGQVRIRFGSEASWLRLDGTNTTGSGDRRLRRSEYTVRGGLTVPLTGGTSGGPGLGPSELSLDASFSNLGAFGSVDSLGMALTWQAAPWLRITGRYKRDEVAISPDLLSLPATVTPNVPYFDPATGENVDVTLVSGGGGNLDNEQRRSRQLSFNLSPWRAYNLQIGADLLISDFDNQAGGLPLPTPAVVAAFPDRFVRDGAGRLVLVDSRTVNFARQHSAEMRTSVSFAIPLRTSPQAVAARGRAPGRSSVQVNLAYSHVFAATTTIREALGPVDLLAGGAVGLYGSRPRDGVEGSLSLVNRGSGLRLGFAWRGPSYLAAGTSTAPDRLRFAPFTRFDLKAYADAGQIFGPGPFTKGLKITVSIDNLTNQRQETRNGAGITPLSYQPYFRDPLGRTVSIELRKAF